HGNASRRKSQSVGVEQDARRFDDVLEIEQRLALSHYHDVEAAAIAVQLVDLLDQQHLSDDLSSGQTAFEAEQGGHAELAVHRTAHLTRDADRVAANLGHEHGFDCSAVFEAQQVAPGAIGRMELLGDLRQS